MHLHHLLLTTPPTYNATIASLLLQQYTCVYCAVITAGIQMDSTTAPHLSSLPFCSETLAMPACCALAIPGCSIGPIGFSIQSYQFITTCWVAINPGCSKRYSQFWLAENDSVHFATIVWLQLSSNLCHNCHQISRPNPWQCTIVRAANGSVCSQSVWQVGEKCGSFRVTDQSQCTSTSYFTHLATRTS